ncbi:CRISPR-associated protein Csx19 [Plectonema radiosum NIES-515]|uniref:CRISPR-associated protein Csx19 n=1 Tax=Plectonema radiosum NIES-515 TaxID=2986073 RepID=A0ABT3ATH4_9CYAN|nr:CRISPR-associated protein Csx19 [Plectonema radiosum]MCV3212429.1 CRISPR-associated protein Csx19 [Plectonema radiosum NIES-515]
MNKPKCEHLEVPANFDLEKWLKEQASKYKLKFLLAHAEDGVIWGKFQDGNLITADNAFPQFAKLRPSTLQQCRIFGDNSEVMLWQTDEGFKARLIEDEHMDKKECICEYQILWGTHGQKQETEGFTLLGHGKQELKHAVPFTNIELEEDGKLKNLVRLQVNHYIDYDDAGVARIYLSRLVNLTAKGIKS